MPNYAYPIHVTYAGWLYNKCLTMFTLYILNTSFSVHIDNRSYNREYCMIIKVGRKGSGIKIKKMKERNIEVFFLISEDGPL